MNMLFNGIKVILSVFAAIILFLFTVIVFIPVHNPNIKNKSLNKLQNVLPFSLNGNDITYENKTDSISHEKDNIIGMSDVSREEVLQRAKAMTEAVWTPKYNLIDEKGHYIFIKEKTYTGIPYSMDAYQVTSSDDFLSKINDSKILYGNDCSGFVSAAWGISRQTTLSLYDAMKKGSKIDGKTVYQISWNNIKPADALLLDNGKGKGHIMLYIAADKNNSDNLNVYEQDIPTIVPYEPIPVARKDIRSKSELISAGYIPIRLN